MGLPWSTVTLSLFLLWLPGTVFGFNTVRLVLPTARFGATSFRGSEYIRTPRKEVVALTLFFGQDKDDGTRESQDNKSKPNLESRLLDSLFSFVDNDNKDSSKVEDDPRKELCRILDLEIWSVPGVSSATTDSSAIATISSDMQAAQSSLMNFLQLWARQLEDENTAGKGLTTPIVAKDFQPLQPILVEDETVDLRKRVATSSSTNSLNEKATTSLISKPISKLPQVATTEGSNGNVEQNTSNNNTSQLPPKRSMKLIFRPPKRYLSYKEQKSMEKGVLPDRKGAKVDAWSPGGVELIVGIAVVDGNVGSTNTAYGIKDGTALPQQQQQEKQLALQLQALRCDVDGDTVIKFTSERAIVRRLQEAIRIWRKVRAMKVPSSLSVAKETIL